MEVRYIFGSLAILAIAALLAGVSPVFAASDYLNVTVNVSSVAEITVLPTSLSWTPVDLGGLGSITPGTDSTPQNIIIKNTGSMNVSQIYLNASTVMDESSNPLSVPNASAYSSAGFIFVRNGTNSVYYHAGRLEWNISSILTSETPGINTGVTNFSHGWYRNASGNDFLWKTENGTGGFCNSTDASFRIQSIAENTTSSPSVSRNVANAAAGLVTCTNSGSGNNAWGTFTCATGPLAGSCVATYYDCTKIYLYRYNKAADYPTCGNSMYLNEGVIIPGGETASVSVLASVPKGTPAGEAKRGMLTIIAS